jgi:gas vesicle protein
MQELLNKLTSEAGLTAEQASKALNTMVTHIKGILPPAFASNIDALMSGKVDTSNLVANASAPKEEANLMDKAGDMATQAKDKIEDLAGQAKEKFSALTSEENIGALKEKAEALKDQTEDKLEDLKDKAEDMAKDALGKLKGFFGGSDEVKR